MWALSYADPDVAKEVFLGQFANAPTDNVPCSREDGEMNMVAADGSECGTSVLSNSGASRLRRLSMTQLNHDRKLVVVGCSRYNLTLVIEVHDLAQRKDHLFACSR